MLGRWHCPKDGAPGLKAWRPRFSLPLGQWVMDVVKAVVFPFFIIISETCID